MKTVTEMSCGCKIMQGNYYHIRYCPLHAAAPELLDALKAIYEDGLVIDALSLAGLEDVLDTAGSAIAKATGGQP